MRFLFPAALAVTLMTGRFHETEAEAQAESLRPAIAVIGAALALLWAIWWLWSLLSPQWDSRTIIAIAIACC